MKQSSLDIMAQAVADWRHRGLITADQHKLLAERYETPSSIGRILLQWLGLGAVFLLGLGILGLIDMMSGSLGVGTVLLGLAAAVCWFGGVQMASDRLHRYDVSGAAVVTVSLVLLMAFLSVGALLSGAQEPPIATILYVTAAVSLGTAYLYRLRWPLLFGLLCFFHAVGSSHYYGGHGSYFFDIQDPRIMAPVAALAALIGVVHERAEQDQLAHWSGFGRLFVIFGLLYFNCSLWFLSLRYGWSSDGNLFVWVMAFTLACIGEIIAGARLLDGKFTGFGVVFLSIDLYTRFYEHFWDRLSAGLFFLVAGVIGLALGGVFEWRANQLAETAGASS